MGQAKNRGSYEDRIKQAQDRLLKQSDSMHQYGYDPAKPQLNHKDEQPVENVLVWGESDWIAIEWGSLQRRLMQASFTMWCEDKGKSAEQGKDLLLARIGEGLNDPATPPDTNKQWLMDLGMYISQCMTPNTGFNHNYAVALCFRSSMGSRGYGLRWLGTQNANDDQQAIAQALKMATPILGHKLDTEFADSKGYKELKRTLLDKIKEPA